jgi:hypothetical protein
MILALSEISVTFFAEILRGRYGRGNFNLQPNLAHLYDLNKDCPLLPEVRKEEDIFNSLKDSVKKATESVIYHYLQSFQQINLNFFVSRFLKGTDDATANKLADGNEYSMASAYERALRIIDKKYVEINFNKIGSFNVTGSTATRDVKIFPNPSCSCPETTTCYHIMAVRLTCDLANTPIRKRPNVTRLRKNAKKRPIKHPEGRGPGRMMLPTFGTI